MLTQWKGSSIRTHETISISPAQKKKKKKTCTHTKHVPIYDLVQMNDSSKDTAQQCDHVPSCRNPVLESSSSPCSPDK